MLNNREGSSDPEYSRLMRSFIAQVAGAWDHTEALSIVEHNLSVVLHPLFLPEFFALSSQLQQSDDEVARMELLMVDGPVIDCLSSLPPERRAPAGLVVLFGFSDDSPDAFAKRYSPWLDRTFFTLAEQCIGHLESMPETGTPKRMASSMQGRLQGLYAYTAAGHAQELHATLLTGSSNSFMESVVSRAQQLGPSAGPVLQSLVDQMLQSDSEMATKAAAIMWCLNKALELRADMPKASIERLGDILRFLCQLQIGAWSTKAMLSRKVRTGQACVRLLFWLAWGEHPVKPYTQYMVLGELAERPEGRNAKWLNQQLMGLVAEEPWLFIAAIRGEFSVSAGNGFTMVPGLIGNKPALTMLSARLETLCMEYQRADHNPLLAAARQAFAQGLPPDRAAEAALAQETARALDPITWEVCLAAIGTLVNPPADMDVPFAEYLGSFNYALTKMRGSSLVHGYAALELGQLWQHNRPATRVEPLFQEALETGRALDHPILIANALDGISDICRPALRLEEAQQYAIESLAAVRDLPPHFGRPDALVDLALIYVNRRMLADADLCLKACPYYFNMDDSDDAPVVGYYWQTKAFLDHVRGDNRSALKSLERMERLVRKIGHTGMLVEVVTSIVALEIEEGHLEQAARRLPEISTSVPEDAQLLEMVQIQQANLAIARGQFEQALNYLTRALALARRAGNLRNEFEVRNIFMLLYDHMGLRQEIKEEQQQIEHIAQLSGDPGLQVDAFYLRGLQLAREDKPREALVAYRAALRLARSQHHLRAVRLLLPRIASCYTRLGQPDLALAIYALVETGRGAGVEGSPAESAWGISDQLGKAAAWATKARLAVEAGDQAMARKARVTALSIMSIYVYGDQLSPGARLTQLGNLALLCADGGDREGRVRALRAALDILEHVRAGANSQVVQQRLLRDKAHYYEWAIEALVDVGDIAGAVEAAESMRGRLLSSNLEHYEKVPTQFETEYSEALRDLRAAQSAWFGDALVEGEWETQRYALFQRGRLGQLHMSQAQAEAALESANKRFETVLAKVEGSDPHFVPLWHTRAMRFSDLQALVAGTPDAALIYLQALYDYTLILVVTSKGAHSLKIQVTRSNWANLWQVMRTSSLKAEGYLTSLTAIEKWFTPQRFAHSVDFMSEMLGRRLWDDLAPQLQEWGIKRITLLPDALLAQLPLNVGGLAAEGMVRQGFYPQEYACDRFVISIAPSAQVLSTCVRRAEKSRGAGPRSGHIQWAALGASADDVALFTPVVAELNNLLGEGSILWASEMASAPSTSDAVETLCRAAADCELLHVNLHGRFDGDRPADSALILQHPVQDGKYVVKSTEEGRKDVVGEGGGGEPERSAEGRTQAEADQHGVSILTAENVASLNGGLKGNPMVVLAACESGNVAVQMVPEFEGLPAAFMQAGASRVVAASWKVSEPATSLLLSNFYERVASGQGAASSLGDAARWLRSLSRDDAVRALETFRKNVETMRSRMASTEVNKARSRCIELRDTIVREGEVLAELASAVESMSREDARMRVVAELRLFKEEADEADDGSDFGAKYIYEQLAELLSQMSLHEWETEQLHNILRSIYELPYLRPYYWAGFQITGAAD